MAKLNLPGTILLTAALLVLGEGDAQACSRLGNAQHDVDPDEAAIDSTPPAEIPAVDVGEVQVSPGIGCGGCGGDMSVAIDIEPPTDDRSAPEEIGYQVEVVEGELPFQIEEGPLQGPTLVFVSTRRVQVFSATLEIRPVDRAGNVGPPTLVEVSRGAGGCNMSLGSGVAAAWLAIAALQLLARRRRLTPRAA